MEIMGFNEGDAVALIGCDGRCSFLLKHKYDGSLGSCSCSLGHAVAHWGVLQLIGDMRGDSLGELFMAYWETVVAH